MGPQQATRTEGDPMTDQIPTTADEDTEAHGAHYGGLTDVPASPDAGDTEGHSASGRLAVETPKPVDAPGDDTEGHSAGCRF
jgi:hypothetical protein